MNDFIPPEALVIYGEGLKLNIEAYNTLIERLGELGISATVLPPNTDTSSFRAAPSEHEAQSYFEARTFVGRASIENYAAEHGYHSNRVKAGWNAIVRHGVFFPRTPQAVRPSEQVFLHNSYNSVDPKPVLFYPRNRLDPTIIAIGHSKGIDFQRGVTDREFFRFELAPNSAAHYRNSRLNAVVQGIISESSVEIKSFNKFIKSEAFPKIDMVGEKTTELFVKYCDDELPSQEELDASEWIESLTSWDVSEPNPAQSEEPKDPESWLRSLDSEDNE